MKQNMISLSQLKAQLVLNEIETVKTMRSRSHNATKRLYELSLHRTMIKDLIIEELEYQINTLSRNKAA